MDKLFVDTNVFLDLLLSRGRYGDYAKSFFITSAENRITLLTSISCIQTIIYILQKEKQNSEQIKIAISKMMEFVDLIDTTKKDLLTALDLGFRDLEDAILYQTAISAGCSCFITQNTKDFKPLNVPILSPQDFMKDFGPVM